MIISKWPKENKDLINEEVIQTMEILKDIISSVRAIRSRMNIPLSKKIDLYIKGDEVDFIDQNSKLIISLAKLESYSVGSSIQKPTQSAAAVVHGMELYIPLEGLVDLDKERLQLNKRKIKIESLLNDIDKKLLNQNFVTRAPKDIVENEKSKLADLKDELEKIESNLTMLT